MSNARIHQQILESFRPEHKEYRDIYLDLYDAGKVLNEAKLTQDQIQAIFAAIDTGVRAGKNVGPDVAGSIPKKGVLGRLSNTWLKFKDKIAQSGPVSGFDVAVDQLQQKIMQRAGGEKGTIGKALKAYRDFATKYPKMQGAIYAAMAIIAGISGWGLGAAAILGAIRTIDRMLQGDRASSAIWKGLKQFGIGAAAQGASEFIRGLGGAGDAATGAASAGDAATGAASAGADTAASTATYTAKAGDNLSVLAKKFNVSVDQLKAVNPEYAAGKNLHDLAAGAKLNIPAPTGSPVYDLGVGTKSSIDAAVKAGTMRPSKYGITGESLIDHERISRNLQIQESLKLPLKSAVYLTPYGVDKIFESVVCEAGVLDTIKNAFRKGRDTAKTGITKEKLDNFWRRNWKEYENQDSVDSNVVIDFLRRMGVKDGLIKSVWDELQLPSGEVTEPTDPSNDEQDKGQRQQGQRQQGQRQQGQRQQDQPQQDDDQPQQDKDQPQQGAAKEDCFIAKKPTNGDELAAVLKLIWDEATKDNLSTGGPATIRQLISMANSAGMTPNMIGRVRESKEQLLLRRSLFESIKRLENKLQRDGSSKKPNK